MEDTIFAHNWKINLGNKYSIKEPSDITLCEIGRILLRVPQMMGNIIQGNFFILKNQWVTSIFHILTRIHIDVFDWLPYMLFGFMVLIEFRVSIYQLIHIEVKKMIMFTEINYSNFRCMRHPLSTLILFDLFVKWIY